MGQPPAFVIFSLLLELYIGRFLRYTNWSFAAVLSVSSDTT